LYQLSKFCVVYTTLWTPPCNFFKINFCILTRNSLNLQLNYFNVFSYELFGSCKRSTKLHHIDFFFGSSFSFFTNYGFFQPLILSSYYWHILPMFIPSLLYTTIVCEQIWMNSYMLTPYHWRFVNLSTTLF
jgi:hypothetical protein